MGMMEYQIGWKIGGDGGNGEKCHNSLAASVLFDSDFPALQDVRILSILHLY